MKKDDLIILLIALALLAGMLITIYFGGSKSRHGVGFVPAAASWPVPLADSGGMPYSICRQYN